MVELGFFSKDIAQIMYAKQLAESEINIMIPEEAGVDNKITDAAAQRIKKMIEEAKLKLEYASDSQLKKVVEMEDIIKTTQDKIKKLYK